MFHCVPKEKLCPVVAPLLVFASQSESLPARTREKPEQNEHHTRISVVLSNYPLFAVAGSCPTTHHYHQWRLVTLVHHSNTLCQAKFQRRIPTSDLWRWKQDQNSILHQPCTSGKGSQWKKMPVVRTSNLYQKRSI